MQIAIINAEKTRVQNLIDFIIPGPDTQVNWESGLCVPKYQHSYFEPKRIFFLGGGG